MTFLAIDTNAAMTGARSRATLLAALFMRAARHWWWRTATRSALQGLPDDILRDVGVYRCQIDLVASEAADDLIGEAELAARRG